MFVATSESAAAPRLPYLPRRLPSYGQFTNSLRHRESLLRSYLSGQIPDHDHHTPNNYQPLTNSDLTYQHSVSQQEITRRFTLRVGQFPAPSDFSDHDYWSPAPRPDDGLPEEAVARLISKTTTAAADDGEVCAVCLDDLHQGEDSTVVALSCRHYFHGDCIGKWLRKKNACPLCRAMQ